MKRAVIILGLAGTAATYFTGQYERLLGNCVLWMIFMISVGLGSLFIVALQHLVGARWSVPLRRVPERLSGLAVLAAPIAAVALCGLPILYPWARPEAAQNHILAGKAVWLNIPFFTLRTAACFALWALFHRFFIGGSIRQDCSKDPSFSVRAKKLAPLFMAIFAVTVTIVAFDWISSLEPEWFSDIFGVYLFSGVFLTALAAVTLASVQLMDQGRLPGVRFDHLYNLGAFMFAFTVFWGYISFAQYMLMWYSNLPEEVYWYKDRIEGAWLTLILIIGMIHFVIPFFILLPRDAKGDPRRLRWVAVMLLVGQFLDLYWLIFPSLSKTPLFSWPEASCALLFIGISLFWVERAMKKGEDMPVGDPFIDEGLRFRL